MTRVLVVADAAWARNDVHAALTSPDFELVDHDDPGAVAAAAAAEDIEAVVVDLQVASMGGMAVARAVRENTTVDGADPTPVILLLDRSADVFLAGRSGAAGWVVKPFTAQELRTAVKKALESPTLDAAAAAEPAESVDSPEEPAAEETDGEGEANDPTIAEQAD